MRRSGKSRPWPLPDGASIALEKVDRIEIGLEGAWTQTAVVVWTRRDGFLGVEGIAQEPDRRPVLELVFPGGWLGIHCATGERPTYRLDENRLRAIVAAVESTIGTRAR